MPRTRGPITAKELVERNNADPGYRRRRAEWERNNFKHRAEFARDSAPVLAALAHAGLHLDHLNDLKLKSVNYRPQLQILLDFIPRITNAAVKETVIRALARKEAKPEAAPVLIKEFWEADAEGSDLQWVIGNSLDVVADDSVFDEMVKIAEDRGLGADRQMAVRGLKNMRNPEAVGVLVGLLDDETVTGHALSALRLMGATQAKPDIEPFLSHKETWWRNEAKKAIAKFDKIEAKGM